LSLATLTEVAHAEPRAVDWSRLVYDLDHVVRGNVDKAGPTSPTRQQTTMPSDDPSPQNLGNAWFGVAPSVTLVARDWASSTRLAGDQLSLVDAMRLSASTRMVVGRARLNKARFTPFIQAGVGEWRVDRTLLPLTPLTVEVATQLGGGFELRLNRHWQMALETTSTTLIREGQNNAVPQTMLWSTFLASRVVF
jgi:hypothetical protein